MTTIQGAAGKERLVTIPTFRLWSAGYFTGFSGEVDRYLSVMRAPGAIEIVPRHEAENNPGFKQIVCYLILRHGSTYFSYRRGARVNEGRLAGRRSIGIGGHVNASDLVLSGQDWIEAAARRELDEEIDGLTLEQTQRERATSDGDQTIFGPWLGAINEDHDSVSRVHFGVVRIIDLANPHVQLRDTTLNDGQFDSIDTLALRLDEFEGWSRFCIQRLRTINRPEPS